MRVRSITALQQQYTTMKKQIDLRTDLAVQSGLSHRPHAKCKLAYNKFFNH